MPPDTELSPMLDSSSSDVDLAAAEWFLSWSGNAVSVSAAELHLPRLPDAARVIVQRQGETVFLPAGWWHVVLNVELSCAVSHSLALTRDVARLWPLLEAEDPALAAIWRTALDLA